jgi:hypothetical protein
MLFKPGSYTKCVTGSLDWQITKKTKSPKTVRFIYEVPAPFEDGEYVDCNEDWHQ